MNTKEIPENHDAGPLLGLGSSEGLGRDGFTYCWLVELFEPGGNSMGYYHTGWTTLSFESRTTRDPNDAKRYATMADALLACARLLHLQGVWRAVEHGFAA
jgi:hypothetical protein